MANRSPYTYTPGYTGNGRSNTTNQNRQPARQPVRQAQGGSRQGQPAPRPRQAPRPGQGGGSRNPAPRPQQQRYVAQQAPARPMKDLVMYALILFVAPLIGIVGVFFTPFLWVFMGVTLVCAAALWYRQPCFSLGQRIVFSALLVVLAVLSVAAVQSLTPSQESYQMVPVTQPSATDSPVDTFPQQEQQQQVQNPALVGFPGVSATATPPINLSIDPSVQSGLDETMPTFPGGSGGDTGGGDSLGAVTGLSTMGNTDPGGAPPNPAVTGARQALESYLQQWVARDFEEMIRYTTEEWRSAQASPQQQLFWNHNWWILKSWTLTNETTSPTADSATFTVIADLSKSNTSQTPVKMEYKALVLKKSVNGTDTWYVDPDSLRTGVAVTETMPPEVGASGQMVDPTPTPEPTISPSTKLWYNSEGGKYYHTSDKCGTINAKNQKYMKSFTYGDLDNKTYSKLLPCTTCNAPKK